MKWENSFGKRLGIRASWQKWFWAFVYIVVVLLIGIFISPENVLLYVAVILLLAILLFHINNKSRISL